MVIQIKVIVLLVLAIAWSSPVVTSSSDIGESELSSVSPGPYSNFRGREAEVPAKISASLRGAVNTKRGGNNGSIQAAKHDGSEAGNVPEKNAGNRDIISSFFSRLLGDYKKSYSKKISRSSRSSSPSRKKKRSSRSSSPSRKKKRSSRSSSPSRKKKRSSRSSSTSRKKRRSSGSSSTSRKKRRSSRSSSTSRKKRRSSRSSSTSRKKKRSSRSSSTSRKYRRSSRSSSGSRKKKRGYSGNGSSSSSH